MKKSITTKMALGCVVITAVLFNGCSNQEVALVNTLANSAAGAAGVSTGNGYNPYNSLSSPSAVKGLAQGQMIGAQMALNPGALASGALAGAISEKNAAQNKKAFGDITDMYVNSDKVNNNMENMMLQSYNKKHGTNFTTMQQLQDFAKVTGYNKQEGTKFSTFTQVREDYNKKHGTNFKSDAQFRAWIAKRG